MVLETAELWLLVADKRHNLETAEKVTRLPLLTIFFFSDIFQAFLHCVWYLKILQRRDIYTLTGWAGIINAILLFWSTFDKSENAGWGELLLRKLAGATKAWMQWCIFMIVFLCICVCVFVHFHIGVFVCLCNFYCGNWQKLLKFSCNVVPVLHSSIKAAIMWFIMWSEISILGTQAFIGYGIKIHLRPHF